MNKYVIPIITLLILAMGWIGFIYVLKTKGTECLRTDPCKRCAEFHGDSIVCQTSGRTRTYYPNGSVMDETYGGKLVQDIFNESQWDELIPKE